MISITDFIKESVNDNMYTVYIMTGSSKASAKTLIYSSLIWERIAELTLSDNNVDVVKTNTDRSSVKDNQKAGADLIATIDGNKMNIDFKNAYKKNSEVNIGAEKTSVGAYASIIDDVLYIVPADKARKVANAGNVSFDDFKSNAIANFDVQPKYAAFYNKYYNGGSSDKFSTDIDANAKLIKNILTPGFIKDYKQCFGDTPVVEAI